VVEVEQWAEIRRMQFVERLSIKEICRRTGRSRLTIRRAVRSEGPPRYQRAPVASKLDPTRRRSTACLAPTRAFRQPGSASRSQKPAMRAAGQSSMKRGAPAVRPGAAHIPAHALPPGRDLPVRPLGAEPPDPGRPRPGAPRLGRGRLPGLLTRRGGSADLLQAGPRHPLWRGPLPVGAGRPPRNARVGSRGRPSCRRRPTDRPTDRDLCRLLRPASGQLAPVRCQRPQPKGLVERLQGYIETSFEPGGALPTSST
jgi:hypothetical protein